MTLDTSASIFSISGTEGFRLTSTSLYTASGINVGIGTSSPAYKLDVTNSANANTTIGVTNSTSGTSALARFLAVSNAGNAFFGMTSPGYTDISSAADALVINASSASGGIVLAQDGVGQAWLNTSGNLGIGTSSPATKLEVNGVVAGTSTGVDGTFAPVFNALYSANTAGGAGNVSGTGGLQKILDLTRGQIVFYTGDTPRARITSGGDFCVNTTSKIYEGLISVSFDGNGGSGDQGIALIDTNASLNGDYLLFVNSAGNVAGKITHNGTTTVAYTTSSDYRLKNTIAPITGALAKVALLKPCTYKWNVDGSDGQGFIAHELAEVVPDCVVGEKDAVDAEGKPRYQGVDTSFLVATLTAAIQELTARVAQLESK